MVTLSTGSPPSDCGLSCCAAPLGFTGRGGSATWGTPNLSSPEGPDATEKRPAGSGGLFPCGQGEVVVDALPHLPDHRDQVVQVGSVVNEVDVAGVDHQQGSLRVVEEEVVVGARERL